MLLAGKSLLAFIKWIYPEYFVNWHHADIIGRLQSFLAGDKSHLMLFVPPQHGKSEIVSRNLPAWLLGVNPNLKIAIASHTAEYANGFCNDIKNIIQSPEYQRVFPGTNLPVPRSFQFNKANYFQVRGKKGFLKAVGVTTALTGTPVDVAIIDDPFKDRADAESSRKRQAVFEWYTDVLGTRLHNTSKVILLMTRWHHDDLAGRLLDLEPSEWEVIKYEAIKENSTNPHDVRKPGAALWPQKHSSKKLLKQKNQNTYSFNSMQQQNPTPRGGNIVLDKWLGEYLFSELEPGYRIDFVADLADKPKKKNDPSAWMAFTMQNGNYYILDYHSGRYRFNKRKELMLDFCNKYDPYRYGFLTIESKSSGVSMQDVLSDETDLNVRGYNPGNRSKEERLYHNLGPIETGKIFLPAGAAWVPDWKDEVTKFPAAPHDESIDLLTMMIETGKQQAAFVNAY